MFHHGRQDEDPYVRKTAAICVVKLFDINPEMVDDRGFLDTLRVGLSMRMPHGSRMTAPQYAHSRMTAPQYAHASWEPHDCPKGAHVFSYVPRLTH